jgi:hypothetical protein
MTTVAIVGTGFWGAKLAERFGCESAGSFDEAVRVEATERE